MLVEYFRDSEDPIMYGMFNTYEAVVFALIRGFSLHNFVISSRA